MVGATAPHGNIIRGRRNDGELRQFTVFILVMLTVGVVTAHNNVVIIIVIKDSRLKLKRRGHARDVRGLSFLLVLELLPGFKLLGS